MIFNIQRYSTHDGPGIRTVVFLKGCTLQCRWCQNPEGQSRAPDLFFSSETCLDRCRLCRQRYPEFIDEDGDKLSVRRAGLSDDAMAGLAAVCPSKALTVSGERGDVKEIREVILRDLPFYRRSGGGLTLSGGEPFLQPGYARELLEAARTLGIHTTVESCLHVPWEGISGLLPLVDLLLADLKHVDAEKFRLWTGGRIETVLENFARLATAGVPVIARVPLVPGFNADRRSIMRIIDFIADCGRIGDVHFLPYHTLGKNKYALLGRPYTGAEAPMNDPELLDFAGGYAARKGLRSTTGG